MLRFEMYVCEFILFLSFFVCIPKVMTGGEGIDDLYTFEWYDNLRSNLVCIEFFIPLITG